ncbi:MAG: response regulator [Candidatus Obscuribacterales bacterium]|jgi:CheY-like chemotaxis protein|nr:response regulator [Candidatus Obscuribacterales bacterium]
MHKRLVVLVAEDHPVNQKVISLLLKSLDVRHDVVTNGEEAVEKALTNDYGLILMDCMMPVVDGFEAAFRIRKYEFHKRRHTPIIACTAMDEERVVDQCIRSGMDDFLGKPIDRQRLKEKIAFWSVIPITLYGMSPTIAAEIKRLELSEQTEPIDRTYLNMLYELQQLDEVLALFLTVTESLLTQLRAAIVHKDVEIVQRMAHEIKGSSYAVSAREMAELCMRLEQAGEEQDWPEAEKTYAALGLAFARVREFLSNQKELLRTIQMSPQLP